ncbi:hypothetical protein M5689_013333 [Euphorbia peplus]|nr:hypothetical protein M5689_013333 [Euphorbia peplus]
MEHVDGNEVHHKEEVINPVFEAKLRELLHNINSVEIKLCSDATKEFIKLLKGHSGAHLLRLYVQSTSNFSELIGAIKLRHGKPGISYVFSLISVILSHPDGKYIPNDKDRITISVLLDKFARSFVEDKLEQLYKELTSDDVKRQNTALLLLASIVRRGSGLASEVAKKFDFKLKGFSKLAEVKKRNNDKKGKHSTRRAFVGFAMSFLEMAKPGLLRWILQQREMYSGVLRGLGNDDDETVAYILSTLRDRVLTEDSLIPPSLRSVLFGSLVLEQLVGISGRENCGAAEVAHNVLLMVCTDPCNGLMPDYNRKPNPLRGNVRRLLELMKKLKATEIVYHRDLLLAIVRGRLSFGSAFMEKFPYNLEDYASPGWFSAVSLAANLISSMLVGCPFGFLDSESDDPPSFDSVDVQNIMNILHSRPLSRSMINKGLLHSDFIVKNGTLRLLLETLKLLDSFFRACEVKQQNKKWKALKQEIQNEIQTLLPDPQVLLTLLSTLSGHVRTGESCLKRTANKEKFPLDGTPKKKPRTTAINEEADIIIGGISSASDIFLPSDGENIADSQIPPSSDCTVDFVNVISELWVDPFSVPLTTLKDAEMLFYSKLLDALKIYLLRMPTALEGSFDFFTNLLSTPSELPSNLLISLLSLLLEYVGTSPGSDIAIRTPPLMYKHLHVFLNLLIFSPVGDAKIPAYNLAQAAISSTGAFDGNLHEIFAWLSFLPGFNDVKSTDKDHGVEVLQSLSVVVISFFCDAISTIGNNLLRYWDAVRNYTHHLDEFRDSPPEFSPLVACVLQKCIRLLSSKSGAFSLSEKSMISVYVCNTLKYLLQIQVDASFLAALISSALSERLQDCCSADESCEWRPFKNLSLFAESLLHKKTCFSCTEQRDMPVDRSFMSLLTEVRKIVESGHAGEIAGSARAFSSAILCTTSDAVITNFPSVTTLSLQIQLPLSFLSYIIYLEQSFLADVSKLWPTVFFTGLEKASSIVNSQSTNDDSDAQETVLKHFDAADAFAFFLGQAPFHVLFPGIIFGTCPCLSDFPKLKELLMAKLAECTSDFVIPYLRLILFWFYQIQLSYRIKPMQVSELAKLEECAQICYTLVNHMLAQLLVYRPSSGDVIAGTSNLIREAAVTIFSHHVVYASFTRPVDGDDKLIDKDITHGSFGDSIEAFLSFCQQRVSVIDRCALDMLKTTFDCLSLLDANNCGLEVINKQIMKACKALKQRLFMELKDKFDLCGRTGSLLPLLQSFYALHALIQFTSPFELFELATWIFDWVDLKGSTRPDSCRETALSIGFCIASDAFKMLSIYFEYPVRTRELLNTFWDVKKTDLDVNLIEDMYINQCKFACTLKLDFAYSCLLEALTAVHRLKHMKCDLLDPLSLVLSRVILSTPMDIVSHCVYETSKTKSKVLFLLVEMSPLHLSAFGYILSGILSDKIHYKRGKVEETFEKSLLNVDYMRLLPAACSFMNSVFIKFEMPYHELYTRVSKFYSEILVRGFCDWKNFVSQHLFEDNHDIFLPSCIEDFVNLLDASPLGKAMYMLKCHFVLSGCMELEQRLKICGCLLSCSSKNDELLDCDVDELEFYPLKQSLNAVNRAAAKVLLCRMMLFPDENKIPSIPEEKDRNSKANSLKLVSNEERQSRMQFILNLVNTWQCMVRKFPSDSGSSRKEKSPDCLQLCRYLELFILKNIHELYVEMCDDLIELQTIPFLEQLVRSSLLYRFEDPKTLNILRSILILFLEGRSSYLPFLQLLLSHSQFSSTIQSVIDPNTSQTGAFFRPIPSILKSVVISYSNMRDDSQTTGPILRQLEILKLLRTLIQKKPDQAGSKKDDAINFRELYFLLLSSYGATLSQTDFEIYSLMSEIESIDRSASDDLVDSDYLWGQAALKIRKERTLDKDASSKIMDNTEAFAEHRRSQFRENLPIDPRICAATVIYFPYDRTVGGEPWTFQNICVAHSLSVNKIKRYDPVFILRFSIQILSMGGYIEAIEFAGLGLLSIAFVGTSSPDIEMRKLAYHFIRRFKETLERCPKKKDVMLLRLLVIYFQNGVEEDWQRIASITATFAAEASLILLDPSNDHYTTLSKHLMDSSTKDAKRIPFFRSFFESNSVNIRAERLWMLRLACAGLNLDDDAILYMDNSIPRTVLGFYSTPLVDNASKEFVLQVVKKSVKLYSITDDLVKKHGIIPWLSALVLNSSRMLDKNENDKRSSSMLLILAVEVVLDILQFTEICEWLQHNALEQLMELAFNLYKQLVGGVKLIKDNVALSDSILQIMISTLKISQRRTIDEPHLTLSFEGLYQIYKVCSAFHASSSTPNAESGLIAILMNTPPVDIFHENPEKLSGFLTWAVSVAIKSDSKKSFHMKNHVSLRIDSEEEQSNDESMVSKLLRWLVATVILSKLPCKLNDINTEVSKTSSPRTLQTLLVDISCGGSKSCESDCVDVLATTIVFLQQLIGLRLTALPSVVSALHILLFFCTSKYSDLLSNYGSDVAALQSRIRCPAEANPKWRWSSEEAWRDVEIEWSDLEKVDEYQACQDLMLIIFNILKSKPSDSLVLSHQDRIISHVLQWETNFLS